MSASRTIVNRLRRDPIRLTRDAWYYEEPKGLAVVHRVHDGHGEYLKTVQVMIPWWKIERSLARKKGKK